VTSTSRSYSDDLDNDSVAPWGFESDLAERRMYAVTVASLPRIRYRSAYDLGCSDCGLTESLATRCDLLLSRDVIPVALQRIEAQLRRRPPVWFEERSISEQWPSGPFDLILLRQIRYRFEVDDLRSIMACVLNSTTIGAHVVGVQERGETDCALTAKNAHKCIEATPGLVPVVHHLDEQFRLDIWERR
jgi:hypothetical protein